MKTSVNSWERPLPSLYLLALPSFQQAQPSQFPSGYYVNQYQPIGVQSPPLAHPLNYIRTRRQYLNIIPSPPPAAILAQNLVKQVRIKLLNLANLTCQDAIDTNVQRSLFELTSFNSFCPYKKHCPSTCTCCSSSSSSSLFSSSNCPCYDQCPLECSCKRSFDVTKNYVNCSRRDLNYIPGPLPLSTTHLDLDHNRLKSLEKNLTSLTKLQYLSLAHNQLESVSPDEFFQLTKIEGLDLSHNRIANVHSRTFSTMFNLKHLYLDNNPWIPKFYSDQGEFQANTRLNYLTFGLGLACNRSIISSSFVTERALTADDCCKHSNIESCQQLTLINNQNFESNKETPSFYNDQHPWNPKRVLQILFHQKYRLYVLIGLSVAVVLLLALIILCCCCCCCCRDKKKARKHPSPAERKLLSNGDTKKTNNHYHKSLQVTAPTTPQVSLSSSTTAIQKLINSTRQKGRRSSFLVSHCTYSVR